MKYYLGSFLLLFFTIPFIGDKLIYGVPLWAIISISVAIVYAISLAIIIDKQWDKLS